MTGNEGLNDDMSESREASTSTTERQQKSSQDPGNPQSHHILPFSSDNVEAVDEQAVSGPATTIEQVVDSENLSTMPSFPKPNPVVRDLNNTADLQLRYFQLQLELKRVRDELQLSGGGGSEHKENEDLSNETVEPENPEHQYLVASNEHLKSANWRLQQRVDTLAKSEADLKRKIDAAKGELESVKARISEIEANNKMGPAEESEVVRLLRDELSAVSYELKVSKLKEAEAEVKERSLIAELNESKLRKRNLNETSRSLEELEELRSRFRRIVGIKSQISAMLDEQLDVNDRNEKLLFVAENHISELNVDLSKLRAESEKEKDEIFKLTAQLQQEEKQKTSLMKEIEQKKELQTSINQEVVDLKQRLKSELEARAKDKELKKGYEQRLSQQQEEIQCAETRIQEQILFSKQTTAELDLQRSSNIELKTRLEEGQKRNNLLSDLIAQGSKDFADAQKEIDHLRAKLHDTQLENDRLASTNSQLKNDQTLLNEKLNDLERELAKQHQIKVSEIGRSHMEIEALRSRLQDEADRAKLQLAELTEKHAVELSHIRERAKEENNKLKSEKNQRENEYKARVISLENEILDLKDEAHAIITERDSLLIRERKDHTQKNNLETALSEVSSRLANAESSLQIARSEASDYKNKFDSARRAEEALIEKSRQLEQAVSKQTLRLQELSNEDLGALKRQAQDGMGSVNELMSLREEYSRQAAEWMMVSGSLNSQIQQLAESNKKLEDELVGWRNNESQREAQLRATVQSAHRHEIDLMRNDYQYSLNIVKSSFAEAENERNDLKKQIISLTSKLQNTDFEFNMAKRQIEQIEKARSAAENESQDLRITEEKLRHSQQALKSEIDSLSLKLRNSAAIVESNKANEHDLIQKLDEMQSNLKLEAGRRLSLESQVEQREKLFKESCERLFAIVYSNSQQIQSLVFIKCYFTKCFPRTDLPNMHDPSPTRYSRTLRGVATLVLASIKFKRAYREGVKRKAQQSESYLLQN